MKRNLVMIFAAVAWIAAAPAFAQGQQAGVLSGRVSTADRLPLPGATVSVTSPALQGHRTVVTDVNGVYSVPGLPPGIYTVSFQMDGMSTVERRAEVLLGAAVMLDQQMAIAPIGEVVEVRGNMPAPVTSPAGAVNMRTETLNLLPVGRTPFLTV